MTEAELVEQVKTRLGLTGDYHDALIGSLIEDVKYFIRDAGADPDDAASVGLIARGVADLWNYGAGDGKFSQVFYQRLTQISIPSVSSGGGSGGSCNCPTLECMTTQEIDNCTNCLKN